VIALPLGYATTSFFPSSGISHDFLPLSFSRLSPPFLSGFVASDLFFPSNRSSFFSGDRDKLAFVLRRTFATFFPPPEPAFHDLRRSSSRSPLYFLAAGLTGWLELFFPCRHELSLRSGYAKWRSSRFSVVCRYFFSEASIVILLLRWRNERAVLLFFPGGRSPPPPLSLQGRIEWGFSR